MKTDARTRYTKKVIRESFLSLLREKPLNRIIVKEICERSEINCATFYRHYQDCFDLQAQLEADFAEKLRSALRSDNFKNIEVFYLHILDFLKKSGESCLPLLTARGAAFPTELFLSCQREALPLLARNCPQLDAETLNLLYHFISQGCSGLMSYWFQSGMKEPPETVAHFMTEAGNAVLEHYIHA